MTGSKTKNQYIPPPMKGLIHVIAKMVVEDYRQELLRKETDFNHESSTLREIQLG